MFLIALFCFHFLFIGMKLNFNLNYNRPLVKGIKPQGEKKSNIWGIYKKNIYKNIEIYSFVISNLVFIKWFITKRECKVF